jgi:hypothetical protein
MKLDYAFGSVPTLWLDGPNPFAGGGVARIRTAISGISDGPFPGFFPVGDIILFRRETPKEQYGITLLLEYTIGHNPPLNGPQPVGRFYPVPGAPILGQVRIALNLEAIAAIQRNDETDIPYKLTLSGIEFHYVKGEEQG